MSNMARCKLRTRSMTQVKEEFKDQLVNLSGVYAVEHGQAKAKKAALQIKTAFDGMCGLWVTDLVAGCPVGSLWSCWLPMAL